MWTCERSFVNGCSNGRIQLWLVDQGEDSLDLQEHRGAVYDLDYQRSSALLASGSRDKTVIVQKVDSTSTLAPLHTFTGHKDQVVEVKFSPSDPHILATYDESGEVRPWDILNGNCNHIFQCGVAGSWYEESFINFSPDGKLLACSGDEVNVLRVASGQVAIVKIRY